VVIVMDTVGLDCNLQRKIPATGERIPIIRQLLLPLEKLTPSPVESPGYLEEELVNSTSDCPRWFMLQLQCGGRNYQTQLRAVPQ
jgi:hypothetical protein